MSLPKRIECLLNFFDIFGFNSGSSKLTKYRKTTCFIYAMNVLLVVMFTLYKVHFIFRLLSTKPMIEVINSIFQYSSAVYFYYLIIFDSIFHRRDHRMFWKCFEKINESYKRSSSYRHFIIKLLMYHFTIYLVTIRVIILAEKFNEAIIVYVILMTVCEIRIFYYIFCVEILYDQMQAIHDDFKKNENSDVFWLETNGFRRIRFHYSHILEMTGYLNGVFGVSQVAALAYCFYMLLADLNWILSHFEELSPHHVIGKWLNESREK